VAVLTSVDPGAAPQRTALAWQRTALSLLAVDVAVLRLAWHHASASSMTAATLALVVAACGALSRLPVAPRAAALAVSTVLTGLAVLLT
jgi:uncharacterized membrane protein YidH (DUF202 family)